MAMQVNHFTVENSTQAPVGTVPVLNFMIDGTWEGGQEWLIEFPYGILKSGFDASLAQVSSLNASVNGMINGEFLFIRTGEREIKITYVGVDSISATPMGFAFPQVEWSQMCNVSPSLGPVPVYLFADQVHHGASDYTVGTAPPTTTLGWTNPIVIGTVTGVKPTAIYFKVTPTQVVHQTSKFIITASEDVFDLVGNTFTDRTTNTTNWEIKIVSPKILEFTLVSHDSMFFHWPAMETISLPGITSTYLLANGDPGEVTFTAVSHFNTQSSESASLTNGGYTIVETTTLGWTTPTVNGSLITGETPDSIIFRFTTATQHTNATWTITSDRDLFYDTAGGNHFTTTYTRTAANGAGAVITTTGHLRILSGSARTLFFSTGAAVIPANELFAITINRANLVNNGVPGAVTFTAVSDFNTLSTSSTNDGYTITDVQSGATCFLGDTKVKTDQGPVAFNKLTTNHSIGGKRIQKVLKVRNSDDNMIFIRKYSLGNGIPNKNTYIGRNHGIFLPDGRFARARNLTTNEGIAKHSRNSDLIYNVLLDTHGKMNVNGMICETLNMNDPDVRRLLNNSN